MFSLLVPKHRRLLSGFTHSVKATCCHYGNIRPAFLLSPPGTPRSPRDLQKTRLSVVSAVKISFYLILENAMISRSNQLDIQEPLCYPKVGGENGNCSRRKIVVFHNLHNYIFTRIRMYPNTALSARSATVRSPSRPPSAAPPTTCVFCRLATCQKKGV